MPLRVASSGSQAGRTRRAATQPAAPTLPSFSNFGNQLPRDIVSTRKEWLKGETIHDRLYGGASAQARDSAIVLDEQERSEASPHSPTSVLGSDTSLRPHPAIEHANSELDGLPEDASQASEGTDSGYNTPEPPTSTVDAVQSESMLSSIASTPTPSLSFGSSTSSTLSVEPSLTHKSVILGVQLLQPDGQELATDTGQRPYAGPVHTHRTCPFWFLDCAFETDSEAQWQTHTATHFRGRPLPQTALCTICGVSFTTPAGTPTHDSARGAWARKMSCLRAHFAAGLTFERGHPDFELFKHLWKQRIIETADYQELVSNYYLANGSRNYATFHGQARPRAENPPRGRDRRRRELMLS